MALTFGLTVVGLGMNIASAQAATFNYSLQASNGYSATGSFTTYNNAPTSFSEVAPSTTPFTTQYLQSASLSLYDPTHTLLDTGSSVASGASSDKFLLLNFNAPTNKITGLDISTQFPGNKNSYYFLSNTLNSSGTFVGAGNTTFNLFQYTQSTNTTTFLGSATSVQVSAVPEPTSPLVYTLALGALGGGLVLKRKLSKQKI